MSSKPKVLFWITSFLTHFAIAYYLQSKLDADFFGIIDINSKPKKFFEDQKFVYDKVITGAKNPGIIISEAQQNSSISNNKCYKSTENELL